MPAEREAHRAIVRHDLVALRCLMQRRHRVVALGAAQQIPIRHGSGGQPTRRALVGHGERAKLVRARELDAAGHVFAHAAQQRETEPHGRRRRRAFDCRIPRAHVHVDGQHLNAPPSRVLQQLRRRVEAHRLAVQQRGEEYRWLVPSRPRARVDEQGEAGRVALREAVVAETLGLREDRLGELGVVPRSSMPLTRRSWYDSNPPLRSGTDATALPY